MSVGAAKIMHNESFKNNDCSTAMKIAIVLFSRTRFFFISLHFFFNSGSVLLKFSEAATGDVL